MELTKEELVHFGAEGWVFLPDLFSSEEVAVLKGELPQIFALRREEIWRRDGGVRCP